MPSLLSTETPTPITNIASNKPLFNLAAAVPQPERSTASVGCYSTLGGTTDRGSKMTTAITFRTRLLPGGVGAFGVDNVHVVLKRAPGSPVTRTRIDDHSYAFYAHDPISRAPGVMLTPATPVSTAAGHVTKVFAWYSITISGTGSPVLKPNTTYWFALLPPLAPLVLPTPSSVDGILLGGVFDPTNTLRIRTDWDRNQFTTAELGSQRWPMDGSFNCATVGASVFLNSQSHWAKATAAVNRFSLPSSNPINQGPLRMGIDVHGFQV